MGLIIAYEYTTRTHLLVTDEDAADFLQSQFTNELRPFEAGQCTYGLWLDVKGKVLADSYVLCEGEERFRLISEHSEAAVLSDKLEHHIIADDVVIEQAPELNGFALVGEGLERVLTELAVSIPAAGAYVQGDGFVVFGGRRSVQASVEVLCLSTSASDSVRVALERQSVEFVGPERITHERIAAGYPLVPVEVGADDMPGEGGLESDAVSFTKGCYLGQEVVARMHNVGKPQRSLFVVSGQNEPLECPLAFYNKEMKRVGDLRTSVKTVEGWTGVALLKHRFAKPGDLLIAEDEELKVERVLRAPKA